MATRAQQIQELLDAVSDNPVRIPIDDTMDSVYEYDDNGDLVKHSIDLRNTNPITVFLYGR